MLVDNHHGHDVAMDRSTIKIIKFERTTYKPEFCRMQNSGYAFIALFFMSLS